MRVRTCVCVRVCVCIRVGGVCAHLVENAEFSHDLLLLLGSGPYGDDLDGHDGLGGSV